MIGSLKIIILIAGLLLSGIFTDGPERGIPRQCQAGIDQDTAAQRKHGGMHFSLAAKLPEEPLSIAEKNGILLLREEEKLARDVYNFLAELYTLPAFRNIGRSEQQHMDEVKFLIDRYKIEDPVEGKKQGEFVNREFSDLYLKLTDRGRKNLDEALRAGAFVEEKDIADLKSEIENHADNQDIKFIYGNLLRGSENHLRAFTGILEKRGIDYKPVILDTTSFRKIISGREAKL